MFYGEGATRNPDGSFIETPIISDVPIESTWNKPANVAELLARTHPNGAPDSWRRFFAGEEVAEEERQKILTALKPWSDSVPTYQGPAYAWRKELARMKFYAEKELRDYGWLDNDPRAVLAERPENFGLSLAAKSGLEFKLKTLAEEIERNAGEINAEENRRRDMELLWNLASGIVGAPASFPDEYKYLLPAAAVERIRDKREYFAKKARRVEEEREAQRLRRIEEKEREKLERLAAIEGATIEELLATLFAGNRDSSIPEAVRRREITGAQFQVLVDLKEAMAEPVMRRAYERLVEFAAEILREQALKPPPTEEEIEAARLAKLREAEEARQREIEARIKAMDEWHYPQLCAEVRRLNLAPLEWVDILPRVTDVTRVTQYKQHFIEMAPRQNDPVRRRVCELMIKHLGSRNTPVAGSSFLGMRG